MNKWDRKQEDKIKQEHDREVEDFLRKNDPNWQYNRHKLEYPYLTENQKKRKKRKHTPFSPDYLDLLK